MDASTFGAISASEFAAFLLRATGNGSCADAECRAREASFFYRSKHRIILWPQARLHMIAASSHGSLLVCLRIACVTMT